MGSKSFKKRIQKASTGGFQQRQQERGSLETLQDRLNAFLKQNRLNALHKLPQRDLRNPRLEVPPSLGLDGKMHSSGMEMSVKNGGKPPKLNFNPGDFISFEGGLHEVIYIFRLQSDPSEWIYCLEWRSSLNPTGRPLDNLVAAMGAGSETPRIVSDFLFLHEMDAMRFFSDIPCRASSRMNRSNKKLIQGGASKVSSGAVLPADTDLVTNS